MKKGDIKKQEILNTAETLFCRKGYEQTSIQDILDCLHTSKGSFYHHYVSKESVLEGICLKRAEQIYQTVSDMLNPDEEVISNLNLLLSGIIPFRDEKLSFLMMLLPIFRTTEGKTVRQYYCGALSECFREAVRLEIQKGKEKGKISCPEPEYVTDIILTTVHGLWTGICDQIIRCEEKYAETDLSEILRMTECCRLMIERMLSLPYGSVELIDLQTIAFMCKQIHNHWIH